MTAPTRIRPAGHRSRDAAGRRRHGGPAAEPVFLDRTGRRRRLVTAVSAAAILLLTLIVLALLAGLTGIGPGPMPGWPAGNGLPQADQPKPRRAVPSPSAASGATPTHRPSAITAPRASDGGQRGGAVPTTTIPTTTAPATPTTSPTPAKAHGRNPSHTPNPHASKSP